MNKIHSGGVFGQVACLLAGAVAPSDDRDGLVADQRGRPVADGAGAYPSVPETRLLIKRGWTHSQEKVSSLYISIVTWNNIDHIHPRLV